MFFAGLTTALCVASSAPASASNVMSPAAPTPASASNATMVIDNTMKRGGFYNKHSGWQAAAQELMQNDLRQAAESAAELLLEDSHTMPFRLGDLGCSQGKNSLRPVNQVIETVRRGKLQRVPVSVLHADLPANDFSALFKVLATPESYTSLHSNIFPSAVGRSYYQRLVPENELHLVMAFVTLQWLPSVPHFGEKAWMAHHPLVAPSAKLEAASEASRYLTEFLLQRAPEVVSGGKLVLSMVAADDDGSFGSLRDSKVEMSMFRLLDEILRELSEEGAVTNDELVDLNVGLYCRTEKEVRSVLASERVADLYSVEKVQRDWVVLPAELQFQNGEIGLEEVVAKSVAAFQAVMEPSYLAPFHKQPEKAAVVQKEVGRRMAERLIADPGLVRFENNHLYMVLSRKEKRK